MSSQHESSEQYIHDNNIQVILKDAIKELCSRRPERPLAFLRDHFGRLDVEDRRVFSKFSKSRVNYRTLAV